MEVPEIETSRLRLRKFTPNDLDEFAQIVADREVMRYLGDGEGVDREGAKIHLRNFIENYWAPHRFGRWALIHKESGELVGHCGLKMLEDTPELVYLIATRFWGKGLATEAARACLKYAFEELKLEKIIALTKPGNHGSQRVLEKIGMQFEKEATVHGIECAYYSLTRPNYQSDNSHYSLSYPTS